MLFTCSLYNISLPLKGVAKCRQVKLKINIQNLKFKKQFDL